MNSTIGTAPDSTTIRHAARLILHGFLVMLAIGCEQVSDRLPPAACSTTTTSVVRLSTTGSDSTAILASIQAITGIMMRSKIPVVVQGSGLLQLQSMGLDQQPQMVKYSKSLAALRAIDCSNIYLLADEAPSVEIATGGSVMEDPETTVLVQTTRLGAEKEVAAAMGEWMTDSSAESLGGGWYWVKPKGTTRTLDSGDAAAAAALENALAGVPASSVTIGLRITDAMRDSLNEAMDEDGGMLTAALAGFEDSMKSLQMASIGLQFGPKPELRAAMAFENEAAAKEFNESWTSTTRSLTSMLGMMMASRAVDEEEEGGDAPPPMDPTMFSGMAEALAMKQDKQRLSLTIDDAGWRKLLP